ncbi:MAG: hypothetical protein JXQ76_04300 [Campylobacterales bacterium]|nr:hypothetical protein [Campylobacterales bacterium]
MQTIELKIEDNYIDSVMNVLKSLKDDMIKEIRVKNSQNANEDLEEFNKLIPNKNKTSLLIVELETIINTKSKNSIIVEKNTILNPHDELSHDIS